jgi:hypothetical protein
VSPKTLANGRVWVDEGAVAEARTIERGVVLPEGHTGSSLFHRVLAEAVAEFPSELGAAKLPEQGAAFKRDYGEILARLEAERTVSPKRVEIARFILRRTQAVLEYSDGARRIALAEHLAQAPGDTPLESVSLGDAPSLRVEVPLDGKLYRGREVIDLAERLLQEHQLTRAALAALHWIVELIEQRGGVLDLRGERFALLGAGAELATTRMLLQAGATVLWIDVSDPADALAEQRPNAGTLVTCQPASNVLEAPRSVAAAIERFAAAGNGPVHLGMFAYASGASKEWRLGAAMNAIAATLERRQLKSLSLLVSPTTVTTWQPESLSGAEQQRAQAGMWKNALCRAGLLPAPGHYSAHGTHIGRSTVSIQGLSYQAAQYISKLAAAETWAVYGNDLQGDRRDPITVSANVAGITRTRSLAHPLFQAAFIGAPRFGVRIFEPASTRALSGLLILHDLLNPAAKGAAAQQPADPREKAAGLLSQQIHGGIYSLPYVLEHAIRMAALIGMSTHPSLLLRRAPKSKSPSAVAAAE